MSHSLDKEIIYAIGDVHGQGRLLGVALERIRQSAKVRGIAKPKIVFLGDLTDRGSEHAELFRLIEEADSWAEVFYIRGNHDQELLQFLDGGGGANWIKYGGIRLVDEFIGKSETPPREKDIRDALNKTIPPHFLNVLRYRMVAYLSLGKLLFVHAGIRPGIAIENQDPHDLMWLRAEMGAYPAGKGVLLVHGHTPVKSYPRARKGVLNLDTGSYLTGCISIGVLRTDGRMLGAIQTRNPWLSLISQIVDMFTPTRLLPEWDPDAVEIAKTR